MEIAHTIFKDYDLFKETNLSGRYITLKKINKLLDIYKEKCNIKQIGNSFLNKPIYSITIGKGTKKILLWTQMHGNESTGTKAAFDLLNLFTNPLHHKTYIKQILSCCTFIIIPILNPDGAKNYTRVNAQGIDLNRDATDLKANESKVLRSVLDSFKPHYCFNLHDQRTIFSVGKKNNPATLSFLAPSVNVERTITKSRIKTMEVIVSMFNELRVYIPNQLGRYTDEFYPTATGDNFQKEGYFTILIEAGHYKNDYSREITRKYNFLALFIGINHIANDKALQKDYYTTYFKIPNIKKRYYDIVFNNIVLNNYKTTGSVIFKEILKNEKIQFIPSFKTLKRTSVYNCNTLISNEIVANSLSELDKIMLKYQFILN